MGIALLEAEQCSKGIGVEMPFVKHIACQLFLCG